MSLRGRPSPSDLSVDRLDLRWLRLIEAASPASDPDYAVAMSDRPARSATQTGCRRLASAVGRPLDWADDHPVAVALLTLAVLTAVMLLNQLPFGAVDEDRYFEYSQALLDGRYGNTRYAGEFAWSGPGMSLLIAPFIESRAPHLLTRFALGPLSITLAIVFLWRALKVEVGSRTAAAGALAFAGLSAYLGFGFEIFGAVHSEAPTAALICLALWLWLRSRRGAGWKSAAGAGVAFGAATMVRVEWGYVIMAGLLLAVAILPARRQRKALLPVIASATALAVCAPWLLYTHGESGRHFQWAVSGGLSFYWTAVSKPPLEGDWFSPEQVARDRRLAAHREAMNHDRLSPKGPYLWDAYLRSVAIDAILADPGRFIINAAKNFQRLLTRYPKSFRTTPPSSYLAGSPGALVFLAALVIAVMLTLRRSWNQVAFAPLFVLAGGLGIHLATSAVPRFIYTLLPLLIWFLCRGATVLREKETSAGLPGTALVEA